MNAFKREQYRQLVSGNYRLIGDAELTAFGDKLRRRFAILLFASIFFVAMSVGMDSFTCR